MGSVRGTPVSQLFLGSKFFENLIIFKFEIIRVSWIRMKWTQAQKIAERLTILNKRAPGMLTRLYNLKKQLADPKTRPAFMAKPLVLTIQKLL